MSILDKDFEIKEEFDYKKYLANVAEINKELDGFVNETTIKGFKTGIEAIDSVIRMKPNELFACTGKKGRGKTTIQQIFFLAWAIANDLTGVMALQENKFSLSKKDMMSYLLGYCPDKRYGGIRCQKTYQKAKDWLDDHFIFINVATLKEASQVVKGLQNDGKKVDYLFCDPINSFDSGFSDTGNSHKDDKITAMEMMKFCHEHCAIFVSQHPTMSGQRSTEDVNSYSGEGGYFLNKADFTWAINRDNGSNINRISVDNVRNKYTGGGVTHPEEPLLLEWGGTDVEVHISGSEKVKVFEYLRKKNNPLNEDIDYSKEDLPNVIEPKELPKMTAADAFGEPDNEIPF